MYVSISWNLVPPSPSSRRTCFVMGGRRGGNNRGNGFLVATSWTSVKVIQPALVISILRLQNYSVLRSTFILSTVILSLHAADDVRPGCLGLIAHVIITDPVTPSLRAHGTSADRVAPIIGVHFTFSRELSRPEAECGRMRTHLLQQ